MKKPNETTTGDELQSRLEAARLRIARLRVRGDASLDDIVARATADTAETLRVGRVGVWFFADEERLSLFHLHQLSGAVEGDRFGGMVLEERDFPTYFQSLQERRSITADDVYTDPGLAEFKEIYFRPLGIGAMLDAPILRNGKVIGVVCCEHIGQARAWTRGERDFVVSVADMLAAFLAESARHEAELHAMQSHIAEVNQLALVTRTADNIALELSDVLTIVMGHADLVSEASSEAPVRELAAAIRDVVERGQGLLGELQELGRQRSAAPRLIGVAEHVNRFRPIVERALGPPWPVVVETQGCVGRVMIDPSHLERILLNLARGARDALSEGGTVTLRVADVALDPAATRSSKFVRIAVPGAGKIMSDERRRPGSSVVRDIVQRAGGFVQFAPGPDAAGAQPSSGDEVRVFLPRLA